MGLPQDVSDAILALDEHWDGGGYPKGLAGANIPALARIMCLAQTLEVFWTEGGPQAACAMARQRLLTPGAWLRSR